MIEFPEGVKTGDLQDRYTREDLIAATNESIDTLIAWIRDLPDSVVTFQPEDPDAHDSAAATPEEVNLAWTLGHVIVHVTASAEESAALASFQARGIATEQRSRHEVHWTTMQSIADLVKRLEESRRIRLAYLETWPDPPHLEVLYERAEKHVGKLNAIGRTMGGLRHEVGHYKQIKEIIRQAREKLAIQTG